MRPTIADRRQLRSNSALSGKLSGGLQRGAEHRVVGLRRGGGLAQVDDRSGYAMYENIRLDTHVAIGASVG